MLNILLLVFGLFFLLHYLTTRKYNYWKKRNVPFVTPVPPFGNYASLILQRKTFGKIVKEICDKFPDAPVVGAFYGTEPVLIPRDPEVIKTILAKDFYYFNGREVSEYAPNDGHLYHLFAASGDYWKVLRQNLTPLFSSAKMKHMFNMVITSTHSLEKQLDYDSKLGEIDVKSMMETFTIKCITASVFGVEAITVEKDKLSLFQKAGTDIADPNRIFALKVVLRTMWPTLFYGLNMSLLTKELNLFIPLIQAILDKKEKNPTNTNEFVSLIIKWKKENHLEGNKLRPAQNAENEKAFIPITDDFMLAQCYIFFIAGFETSATTMTHTLYELSKNERIQNKVREEIDSYLKRHDNQINYDSLSELQYLDACINEALRMYPPLGCITREVMHDYTLSPGIKLDKGVHVHIPVEYLHYNPDLFPEPDVYQPERFVGEQKQHVVPYSFMPFGEGPRICIGMRFGKMQVMAGLITVLKSYKVRLGEGVPQKMRLYPYTFVTTSADPIKLKFIRRDDTTVC